MFRHSAFIQPFCKYQQLWSDGARCWKYPKGQLSPEPGQEVLDHRSHMVNTVCSRCTQHLNRLQHIAILGVDPRSFGNPAQFYQQLDARFVHTVLLQEF